MHKRTMQTRGPTCIMMATIMMILMINLKKLINIDEFENIDDEIDNMGTVSGSKRCCMN